MNKTHFKGVKSDQFLEIKESSFQKHQRFGGNVITTSGNAHGVSGLLKMPTSSPSLIVESLVPVLIVIVDFVVFVDGLRVWMSKHRR